MKYTLIILISLLSKELIAEQKEIVITGRIKGLTESHVVVLRSVNPASAVTDEFELTATIDTAICSTNGAFSLNATLAGEGQLFTLEIRGKSGHLILLLSGKDLTFISGKSADWPKIKVNGSAATTEWINYKKKFDAIAEAKVAERNQLRKDYLIKNPHSLCAAFIILKSGGLNLESKTFYYDRLTQEVKNSYWGKLTSRYLEDAKRRAAIAARIQLGNQISDFLVTNTEGNQQSIYELLKRNKYTLIDFWATWCNPCIDEIPALKKLHEKYESKGFNIIGLSIDKDEAKWKKSINDLNLRWPHVRDNVENASDKKFGNAGIPGYILVDQLGKIVYFKQIIIHEGVYSTYSSADETNQPRLSLDDLLGQLLP